MVFPTIPTTAEGRVAGLNQLNLTATLTGPNLNTLTMAPGDLLIAIAGEYQSDAGTDAAYTGWAGGGLTWTEIRDSTGTAVNRLGVAIARVVTGSETGTVTVTRSGTLVGDASMIVLVVPGAHSTTNPEATVMATGNPADPASLSPSWGAEDTLWIAVNGNGMTSGTGSWTANNGAPTNYTGYFGTAPADTSTIGDFGAAVAFRQLNATSEDAGAFSQDTTNARSSALVIAVRPAPAKNTAATQVATSTSNYNSTSPKSTGSLSWQSGDDVYVIGETGSNNTTLSTPTVTNLTGTGLTFAAVGTNPVGGASNSLVYKWKATATGSGSGNIQSTDTGTDDWGIRAWQFRGSDGTGNVATLVDTTHVLSLTRANDHSLVIAGLADFSATAVGSSSVSPATGGTLRDAVATGGAGTFTAFTADWTDQSTAGATSYGVANNTSTGAWTKVAIEILGTVSTGATVTPAVIATTVALPTAGLNVGAAPAATAAVVALPQATPSTGGGDATAAPAVAPVVAALPAAAVNVAAAPAAVAATTALPQTAVSVTAAPVQVAATVALPKPNVAVGTVPAVLAAITALPQAVVSVGTAPAVVPVIVSLPQAIPSVAGSATATPAVIATTVALPKAAISVGVVPAVITAVVNLPAAAVSVATRPAVIPVIVALPAASTVMGASPTPATIQATVTIPAAVVGIGAAPATIPITVNFYVPETGALVNAQSTTTLTAGRTSAPTVLATIASVAAVTAARSSTSSVSD